MSTVVKTEGLSKKYKYKYALRDFNITIEQGDIYGLIGVNGAGKSTLIKIIAGITEPSEGSVSLFGSSESLDEQRRRIGSVIENPSFFPNLSAKQNLVYYATVMGIKDRSVIDRLLKRVNLDPESRQTFRQFSLGMKQRLGIALALMNSPAFIILDEPTNGLDPKGIMELRDIITSLNAQGVTFLICSHILSELSQIATRYGIVDDGRFVCEFTNEELLRMRRDKLALRVEKESAAALNSLLESEGHAFTLKDGCYEIELLCDVGTFIERLVENGIKITFISQIKTSLEEVFFGVIGGGKNA